ncbi:threonine/serine exporter family protein [Pontibacillus sp. HMF3514]|uniref:threonine/serine exporter family protein n=1 Tax=Pontibacillus sp. HMF3514 TaxID=2692425 RepID=UPI0013202C58|nr:threonine/serine exporter family protein [Pontibacillus sp. HMF3514]QHE51595.1 threonine/serine exporter family protein [Pontibacillus sp. HMF3514]
MHLDTAHTQKLEMVELCLLIGRIMLQNGAETYRVEDTMTRIAASYGKEDAQSFVTPTGIFFSVSRAEPAKLVRVYDRATNLSKVTAANNISRNITGGRLTIVEAYEQLSVIDTARPHYSLATQVAAASVASGCFAIMFQGNWYDFLPACISGGAGFVVLLLLHHLFKIKFFAEFLASLLIGTLAYLFISFGVGHETDKIVIGSVMPLVPGLHITNAVRDLMAGHLVSGLSKGAEAFLTATAIGGGVAIAFSIF